MKENELTKFGKVAIVMLFVIPAIVSAVVNIYRNHVPHPMAFLIVIAGILLFVFAKL